MNTVKGSIVKAVAGREKNGFLLFSTAIPFLLTLQTESEERLRSLKEKLIHISPTGTVIEGSIKTNPQIRKILNNFRKSEG